jgi:hypothetical protein
VPDKISPVDKILCCGAIFFTVLLIMDSKWSPNDGQTFQVLSNLLSGCAAAFFARIKPTEKALPPETRQETTQVTKTVTPAAPEPEGGI